MTTRNTHDRDLDHHGTEDASVITGFEALPIASVLLVEGATPATPPTGGDSLFFDSADHLLKWVDDAGLVHIVGSGGGLTFAFFMGS